VLAATPLISLRVPQQERVVVGDHHLGLFERWPEVWRHQVPLLVVVVFGAGVEHPQPVPDGDARGTIRNRLVKRASLRL
jgi:hypothetical protein